MRSSVAVVSLLLAVIATPSAQAKTAPGVGALLSVVPGLGQAVNGEVVEGLGWFAAVATSFAFASSTNQLTTQVGFSLWAYNIYDSYRDLKPKNKMYTGNSVFIDTLGILNPLNLIDPIGGPIVGIAGVAGARTGFSGIFQLNRAIRYTFVGLGEEGLYRGFLFPGLSDVFGSRFLGALFSSALFGLSHTQYGGVGRFTVGFLGLLWCWESSNHDYDHRGNMFSHAWYDFFLPPTALGREEAIPIPGIRFGFRF